MHVLFLYHFIIVLKIILIQILKDMHVIKSKKSDFVILDKYRLCRASALNLNRKDSIEL